MSDVGPSRARHSDPTLLTLETLGATMNDAATAQEREAWWNLVLRIAASIDSDPRAAKSDQEAMRRLKEGVSNVYGAINRGLEPNYSGVLRAITSLRYLLEARTTGFDGHRLR